MKHPLTTPKTLTTDFNPTGFCFKPILQQLHTSAPAPESSLCSHSQPNNHSWAMSFETATLATPGSTRHARIVWTLGLLSQDTGCALLCYVTNCKVPSRDVLIEVLHSTPPVIRELEQRFSQAMKNPKEASKFRPRHCSHLKQEDKAVPREAQQLHSTRLKALLTDSAPVLVPVQRPAPPSRWIPALQTRVDTHQLAGERSQWGSGVPTHC